MKRLAAVALVLAALALAPALAAQTSAGFTGKWEGTMTIHPAHGSESQSMPALLELTQSGRELKGTAGPPNQQLPIEKGVVADGKATFEVQSPNRRYTFTVAIVDGRLKGDMSAEGLPGRMTIDAARAK